MWGPRDGVPENCAVVVRLTPEMYRSVALEADRDERSMSAVVRRLVDERFDPNRQTTGTHETSVTS